MRCRLCMLGSPILAGLCILQILTTLLVAELYHGKLKFVMSQIIKKLKVKKRSMFPFLLGMEP